MKEIITLLALAVLLFAPVTAPAAERGTAPDAPAASAVKSQPQKLDINTASAEQLLGVPGIGPRTAQAIVELRVAKGSFKRVEDLLEVTGIKKKKLAAIARYLEVLPPQTSAATTPSVQSR